MSKEINLDKTKDKIREVVCSRCDNTTNHKVCSSVSFSWGNDDVQGVDTHEIIRCLGCDSISFRIGSSNSEDFEADDKGNLFYPESEEIYPSRLMGRVPLEDIYSLPDKVRSIYKETHAALCTKLKILAGVGIRALVEAVCSEKETEGRNLEGKIDDLVKKEVLTKRNSEILHKTRLLGNDAAHKVKAPSDSELDVAFDIVENLLETVYIIPKKAERLK
ncbi:MAG: hypothetical protein G01um101419_49 [Parcubacteria group bacterium Gr01-1014_19]|nr:MAG: hypothetical protein G01um101419_49 [Parcubacteria group bacterium Gr01-1014_19]